MSAGRLPLRLGRHADFHSDRSLGDDRRSVV